MRPGARATSRGSTAHRVTLLATADSTGASIADIDGSTWDPWAQRLLFTTESPGAPTYAATPGYPSTVTDVSGALGRGGYEGIQNDSQGNIWIVEDTGGSNNPGTVAKRPNSFVYRYVPAQPGDLQHGKLEALQVLNAAGDPITFESQAPLNSADAVALHTYGQSFRTKWVLVHDTAVSNTPFNANDVAKAAHATPFKRPENGAFRPGSKFTEFYFDETGDTNATSVENDTAGGWGSVMKLTQASPGADTGSLTMLQGEPVHSGLRQRHVPLARQAHVRPGRGRQPARPGECARLGPRLRRERRLLECGQPAAALARRGPRPVGDARLGGRAGRQRDHRRARLRRRPVDRRDPRGEDPAALRQPELALVLDAAARRQQHVGGHSGLRQLADPEKGRARDARARPTNAGEHLVTVR